jgi:hypothetical protein
MIPNCFDYPSSRLCQKEISWSLVFNNLTFFRLLDHQIVSQMVRVRVKPALMTMLLMLKQKRGSVETLLRKLVLHLEVILSKFFAQLQNHCRMFGKVHLISLASLFWCMLCMCYLHSAYWLYWFFLKLAINLTLVYLMLTMLEVEWTLFSLELLPSFVFCLSLASWPFSCDGHVFCI